MGLSSLPKFHPELDIPAKQLTQEELAYMEYRKTHPNGPVKGSNPRPYPISGRGSRGGGRGRGRSPRTITRDPPSATDPNDSYAKHVLQSQQRAALIKAQQAYQQQGMMQHLQAQQGQGKGPTGGPLAPQRGQQFYVDPYRLYAKVR